ncbi:hypothetical protein Avbf_16785 [Armadillidium vulgare]|nr:hypothetical protein Avbf_16785 [Armadillidium vulgare]
MEQIPLDERDSICVSHSRKEQEPIERCRIPPGFEHVPPPKAGNNMYFEYVDSYEFLKDKDDPDELRRNQWKTRIHEQMVSLSSNSTPHSVAPTSDERERIAKCRSISRSNPALLGTTELECKQRKTHRRSLSLVSHVPESRKSVRGIAQPRSRQCLSPKERLPGSENLHGSRQKQRCSDKGIHEQSQIASVRSPQLIDLSLKSKKDRTQSIEIVKCNPGEEPKEAARDKIIKDKNEHSTQPKNRRVPKEVVKSRELSLISENDYCLSGKEKRIPKKVVKPQELSLTSENEHSVQSKGKHIPKMMQELSLNSENEHSLQSKGKHIPKMMQELSLNSENDSPLMEKNKPSFIATIEQTRDIPAGSRNLFEVTLSDMGKKSPHEGQLLVTETNNAVKEDGDMYVRRGRSHVKKEKILIKGSNLDGKSVKLKPSNARGRVARMREMKNAPTRSVWDSQMYINNMHRKYVRKKASIHQGQMHEACQCKGNLRAR